MRPRIAGLAVATLLATAQSQQTFTGRITDNMCAKGDHSQMKMGEDDAECTVACVRAHGALYVLYDGKTAYTLSDQTIPEAYAGSKVTVRGTLDAKTNTIHMDRIAAAP